MPAGKKSPPSWTPVDGATSYQVYKKSTGSFRKVTTTTDTSYECTNLREGISYKFVVKAVRTADTYTVSKNSNIISARTDMKSGRARLMPAKPLFNFVLNLSIGPPR